MKNQKRKRVGARRKKEYSRREGLHRLLDLVLDINGINRRDHEITGNLPTAFFDFSGHTAAAHMRVYTSGWGSGQDHEWCCDVWEDGDINEAIKQLEKLKFDLRSGANEPT
ncbi:nitrogenase molybdenum-iron protein subunit beta [Lacrimispora sp.]|uniref:nitrogenase molybdenum-iron protein subunit beta n=1 Tax=Lacrimispora sp. TaxID=2719234 RepID=UPI0028AD5BBD|nr:nitrogenase molybdenum-iron protein subunit beta [Lacrimispora sp.]